MDWGIFGCKFTLTAIFSTKFHVTDHGGMSRNSEEVAVQSIGRVWVLKIGPIMWETENPCYWLMVLKEDILREGTGLCKTKVEVTVGYLEIYSLYRTVALTLNITCIFLTFVCLKDIGLLVYPTLYE